MGQVVSRELEKLRLRRCVEVAASQCSSSKWQELVPQLQSLVQLNLECEVPCCLPDAPTENVPEFEWRKGGKEDDPVNIVRALAFLEAHLLPPGVTAVPVQSIAWLSGAFQLASVELVIKTGKTDYLFVLTDAWDRVAAELNVSIKGHAVDRSAQLRDHMERLLPDIIGFYEVGSPPLPHAVPAVEGYIGYAVQSGRHNKVPPTWLPCCPQAKTPTALMTSYKRCRSQAVLEHLAAWHMCDRKSG